MTTAEATNVAMTRSDARCMCVRGLSSESLVLGEVGRDAADAVRNTVCRWVDDAETEAAADIDIDRILEVENEYGN